MKQITFYRPLITCINQRKSWNKVSCTHKRKSLRHSLTKPLATYTRTSYYYFVCEFAFLFLKKSSMRWNSRHTESKDVSLCRFSFFVVAHFTLKVSLILTSRLTTSSTWRTKNESFFPVFLVLRGAQLHLKYFQNSFAVPFYITFRHST